jgi:hypothetical protein
LRFFFTHRSQPPQHTPDKLLSVSRSSAYSAIPIISSDHNKPATHQVFSQPPRAPPSSPQPIDLPSSTGHWPRSPSSTQTQQSLPHPLELPAFFNQQRRRRNQEQSRSRTETNRSVNQKETNCLVYFWVFAGDGDSHRRRRKTEGKKSIQIPPVSRVSCGGP